MRSVFRARVQAGLLIATTAVATPWLVTFGADAGAAEPPTISLQVSDSATRSAPRPLTGATLVRSSFVFAGPIDGVDEVHFRLDGKDVAGRDRVVEYDPPFDLIGGLPNGTAKPLELSKLTTGAHVLTADVRYSSGSTTSLTARFAVGGQPTATPTRTVSPTTSPTITPTTRPTIAPTRTPAPTSTPAPTGGLGIVPGKLVFGLGPEADGAVRSPLAQQAKLGMLTSWYDSPDNLAWMSGWSRDLVPQAYARGQALQLVTFTDGVETQVQTKYGTACGRPYPLSARYLDDMRTLAGIFKGSVNGPPLYVTAFTEFQTYGCIDNSWNPNPQVNAYYRALKDRYLETVRIFHEVAPNSRVALSWGGWQSRFDDAAIGGGRSMFAQFADVMRASDFTAFQAMQSDRNDEDILAMTTTLRAYKPVMLAHYKPDNRSQATFEADVRQIFSDDYVRRVTAAGLFGLSFMDQENMGASTSTLGAVVGAVTRYGAIPTR